MDTVGRGTELRVGLGELGRATHACGLSPSCICVQRRLSVCRQPVVEEREWIRIVAPPPPPLSIAYLAAAWRNSCCSAAGSDWPPPCRSDDHANAHRSPARAESVDTVPAGWGTPRGTSRHAMRPHRAHDDNLAAVCVSTSVANDVPDPVLSAPAVRTHY